MKSFTFLFTLISLFITIFLALLVIVSPTNQDWDLEFAVAESASHARDVDATDLKSQNWLLMYCSQPYDPVTYTCGGKCSPWDQNGYTLRNAAGTECIAIRPSNVNFTACNDIVTGRQRAPARCTWVGNWKSEQIYAGMDGFTFFDAPGTNSLFITKCDQDSAKSASNLIDNTGAEESSASISQTRNLKIKPLEQDLKTYSQARDVDIGFPQCSPWTVIYCNKPYDDTIGQCGGKCSTVDQNSPLTFLVAPGTECVGVYPSNLNFTVSNRDHSGRFSPPGMCKNLDDFVLDGYESYFNNLNFQFYNVPGTNLIETFPCYCDGNLDCSPQCDGESKCYDKAGASSIGQRSDSEGIADGTDIASREDRTNSTGIVPVETGDTDGVPGPPPKPCTIPNGWKMIYCNRGYDTSIGICGGKCTYWDNQQKLVIDAPGTQCIATIPAFQPLFRACNSKGKCTESAGWPLNGKHDIGGISIYEASGTQTIIITPCG